MYSNANAKKCKQGDQILKFVKNSPNRNATRFFRKNENITFTMENTSPQIT
jgi:hypothetical protein